MILRPPGLTRTDTPFPYTTRVRSRSEDGRRIRKAFVAPPGRKLLACDYSQIELRIMAHLSEDAGLLSAFASGADTHRATAAEVFSLKLEDVTANERRAEIGRAHV